MMKSNSRAAFSNAIERFEQIDGLLNEGLLTKIIKIGESSDGLHILPVAVLRLPTRMPGLDVIASLLILGLICTALALLIFFAPIAEVGASRAIVNTYVNPAVSVLLGVTVLGEQLTIATVAGFLLIIAGSCLSTTVSLPLPFTLKALKSVAPRRE
jgi:threonine/homoserine efflux transporter RhtA